jgi:probable HAF family extracellular repeat protein
MTALKAIFAGIIAILFAHPVSALAQTRYAATFLTPGFADKAINDSGLIIGSWQGSTAIFNAGSITVLPIPASVGKDINIARDVVGDFASGQAYAYIGGRVIELQRALPGRFKFSEGMAINKAGQVVGVGRPPVGESSRGFIYYKGRVRLIPTFGGDWSWATVINEKGVVAGYASYGGPALSQWHHAFVLHNGHMQDLGTFGGLNSEANGINNHDQVVGSAEYSSGVAHPFLYERGRLRDLGTLGGNFGSASAINDSGTVVGESDLPGGQFPRAFLYRDHRIFDLSRLVALPVGWELRFARDINNAGQILATACKQNDCASVRLDPIQRR